MEGRYFVTDLTGHKIETKARQKRIHDALVSVFEAPGPVQKEPAKVVNG